MPSFGADMEAGTLVQWHVKPGDRVARGDIVAVIETQKGAIDMEVFSDGTIGALLVQPGDKVPVGTPIATIDDGVPELATATAPVQRPETAPPVAGESFQPTAERHLRASPRARMLAREHRLDLAALTGSGPDGAIVEADIEQALGRPKTVTGKAPGTFDADAMRQAIAAAMSRSKREIPHYYLTTAVDISATLDWLRTRNDGRPPEQRLLLGALLVKATALALQQAPALNGYYIDGRFEPAPGIHIGMAINLRGGGLVVPALLDADRSSVDELMTGLKDITERARHGGLRSSEMSAATITLTSLGDRGVDCVQGVIFPPQVAIVGFGTPALRPWVLDDRRIEARTVIQLSLAADHRVSDGHLGARFLRELARQLQQPESL